MQIGGNKPEKSVKYAEVYSQYPQLVIASSQVDMKKLMQEKLK